MLCTGIATGAAQFPATEVYKSSVNPADTHYLAMELSMAAVVGFLLVEIYWAGLLTQLCQNRGFIFASSAILFILADQAVMFLGMVSGFIYGLFHKRHKRGQRPFFELALSTKPLNH